MMIPEHSLRGDNVPAFEKGASLHINLDKIFMHPSFTLEKRPNNSNLKKQIQIFNSD